MASALGSFLASLAWSFLKWYLERQTIRDDERRKMALEALEQINLALDWSSRHPITPSDDPFGDFVRDPDNFKAKDPNPGPSGPPRSDTDSER